MTGLHPRWRAPLAGILSGLLFALAFPPVEWVLLLPLALVPWLASLAREESRGRALWSGVLFGVAHWCASIPWIYYVVTRYGGQSGPMGVVCLVILSLILAEWPAIVAWGTVAVAPPGSPWRMAAFPLLWMATEHVRSELVYGGFPWNLVGQALYHHPVWLQTASIWGVYGVGALVVGLSALLAAGITRARLMPMVVRGAAGARRRDLRHRAAGRAAAGAPGAARRPAPAQPDGGDAAEPRGQPSRPTARCSRRPARPPRANPPSS